MNHLNYNFKLCIGLDHSNPILSADDAKDRGDAVTPADLNERRENPSTRPPRFLSGSRSGLFLLRSPSESFAEIKTGGLRTPVESEYVVRSDATGRRKD